MQSRYVDSPRSSFSLRFSVLRSRSASREVTAGVEKLSPRFHPNVTDLTSRGDAARFPRIIILLSYNSFNSRESKTRGVMPGSLAFAQTVRRAFALCFKWKAPRRDATRRAVAHGSASRLAHSVDAIQLWLSVREIRGRRHVQLGLSSSRIDSCVYSIHVPRSNANGCEFSLSILLTNRFYSRYKVTRQQVGRWKMQEGVGARFVLIRRLAI